MANKHRRKYLINLRFQIKWTLIITLTGLLSAGLFGAALWVSIDRQASLIEDSIRSDEKLKSVSQDLMVLVTNLPDRTDEERTRYTKHFDELDQQFEASRKTKADLIDGVKQLRYFVILFVILIGACLFIWGIFLTHRIAGPLYVIKSNIEKLKAHGQVEPRPLRKKDEFQPEYEAIRAALTRLYCYTGDQESQPPQGEPGKSS
jgi:hypothetical protein